MSGYFVRDALLLRPLEPEDLDQLYRWENDTRLWENGSTVTPFSKFALRQYLQDARQDIYQVRQLRMMIVDKGSNRAAGTIDLYDFDPLNGRAGIGILVDEDFRRRGYGLQALSCMEDYAFNHLKLHQLYAFVPAGNKASRALFEKAKYEKSAVLKDWVTVSREFVDVIVMQKIKK
ncbi:MULTISPECIES: GNAT family N-acetyltransferase [Petrimonas]|jgi:diamine N-acetyltransferase|uniref:Putative N-acetyltransferase p20 n=1 Tax=Petrimonas mucosa TaxID=1642646 RepID=A0A1G4G9T5_9BACT|nr:MULTISPECIES: GNAT family N-acetyltransferase [Petrimonas]MDD3559906.1 GNAT family N-acetyltransferase [Petrimonas mucosa]SCM59320.1 putative N-acetyltransferase p20 [Petrimonas mucosa]SFU44645.1 diamine N-acetyltransferase [Porphyromonadaceae bacterium KHP3R9]HHT28908.1 GNAT family N-acetyltransferase [Petrimonas mucosa]